MTLEMLSVSTVASRFPTPPARLGQPGDHSPPAGPVAWCSKILQDLLPPQDLYWFLLPGKSVPSLHGSCLASSREAFPDHSHPPCHPLNHPRWLHFSRNPFTFLNMAQDTSFCLSHQKVGCPGHGFLSILYTAYSQHLEKCLAQSWCPTNVG